MSELIVRNPYSGSEVGRLPFASREEADHALARSKATFLKWRHSTAWDRARLLNQVAATLEVKRDEFATLICQEAGKPIVLARGEVDRALGVLRWAAGEAQRFAGELIRTDAGAGGRPGFGMHTRFPRGVVLGITPFNFPLNLVAHKVAPAVACGCSILIKPSPMAPLVARKFVELFAAEPGLVQSVMADDGMTAELTHASDVAMISFTGSARVGWQIRKQVPEKPTALELGGNAWVAVFADTPESDFKAIAGRIAGAAFGYAGQSCISVQNVAVAREIWPDFKKALASATEAAVYGDPENPSVVCGPVIHEQAAERIRSELSLGSLGAQQVISRSIQGKTARPNLVVPTLVILPEAREGGETSLTREEVFGPVMIARAFRDEDELISLINSGRYGLQAGIYTHHWPTIERMYRDLDVGGLIVNDVPTTRYDHQPYGGVKDSGLGREGLRYAMEEMTESKFLALSSRRSG